MILPENKTLNSNKALKFIFSVLQDLPCQSGHRMTSECEFIVDLYEFWGLIFIREDYKTASSEYNRAKGYKFDIHTHTRSHLCIKFSPSNMFPLNEGLTSSLKHCLLVFLDWFHGFTAQTYKYSFLLSPRFISPDCIDTSLCWARLYAGDSNAAPTVAEIHAQQNTTFTCNSFIISICVFYCYGLSKKCTIKMHQSWN